MHSALSQAAHSSGTKTKPAISLAQQCWEQARVPAALGHLRGARGHPWFWQRAGAAIALRTATSRVWRSRCGGRSFCLPAMAPGAADTVPGPPVCARVRLPCQRGGDLPAALLRRLGMKTLVDNK